MKKFFSFILCLFLLLTFSSCNNKHNNDKIDYKSIKINSINDFTLQFVPSDKSEKRFICELDTGEWEGTVNDFNLYYYGMEEVNISLSEETIPLHEALENDVITTQMLLDKFEADSENDFLAKKDRYSDGGTTVYLYGNCKVIKFYEIGDSKDLYIGTPDMKKEIDEESEVDGKKDYSGIKAENTNDFELSVVKAETAEKKYIMHIREYDQSIDGDRPQLFYYGLEQVNISVDGTTFPLVEAIKNDVINTKLLLDKFKADKDAGKCKGDMYKDGGTLYYEYSDFKVLKFNSLESVGDLYIGVPDMPYEVKDK